MAVDVRGDFQTPPELAAAVWRVVDLSGVDLLMEPTVGLGVFIATTPAKDLPWLAYDVNDDYVESARTVASEEGLDAVVTQRNAFDLSSSELADRVEGRVVLAIGNPPWVTNAAQGTANAPTFPPSGTGSR